MMPHEKTQGGLLAEFFGEDSDTRNRRIEQTLATLTRQVAKMETMRQRITQLEEDAAARDEADAKRIAGFTALIERMKEIDEDATERAEIIEDIFAAIHKWNAEEESIGNFIGEMREMLETDHERITWLNTNLRKALDKLGQ